MNHDLIKQLELAIAVERGEVRTDEIQVLGRPFDDWTSFGYGVEIAWNFASNKYRRKSKPLECWVNVYGPGGKTVAHTNEEEAKLSAQSACLRVAVHMREVTNE